MNEDFCILDEFISTNHLLELSARNKKVLLAVLFATAWRVRGIGDGKVQVGNLFQQFADQRGFAGPGRGRNDVNQWLVRGRHHSRFCTCSRDFSLSAFIASPASGMFSASPATPEIFESRIFASRFLSCNTQSIFFPTSPP